MERRQGQFHTQTRPSIRLGAAFLFTATMMSTSSSAHAQDQGPIPFKQGSYFILEGGANFHAPTTTYPNYAGRDQRAYLKTGFAISGAGGYKWSNGLRAEGEVSFHQNALKYFDTPAIPYTGRQISTTFMVNAIYDFSTGSRFTPYVGVGVGGTVTWLKDVTYVITGVHAFESADSTKFAYQGIAGVAIVLAPQWEALIDVHYRRSDGHSFTTPTVTGGFNILTNYNIHEATVMAGLRYAFPSAHF